MLKKVGLVSACLVLLATTLLYLVVRPPNAPSFVEIDCGSVTEWKVFPAENANWEEGDRKLFYLIEPQPALNSDIRHYVLKTNLSNKARCFDLKGYSPSEIPEERYGHDLVIYTKYHERSGWVNAQVNQLNWWQRTFSDLSLGGDQPVDPSPEMQTALVDKPAGVYEWKAGNLIWVASLGSTHNLWEVMFHGSLFDVIDHSGIYYVSPPGMNVISVIDLRSVGKS
jgi:hypothetical protein